MNKIRIPIDFQDDYTTRAAGERLRKLICQAEGEVLLDFMDCPIASASFLDEGLAKLAQEGWSSKDFQSRISLTNMYSKDLQLLKTLCLERGLNIAL